VTHPKHADFSAPEHLPAKGGRATGPRVQLMRQLAGMSYEEQLVAVRPPAPPSTRAVPTGTVGAVQQRAEATGTVQLEQATAREGVELVEFTLLNGLKGRYAKTGTQAKDPTFEAWALEFETSFSNTIQTDPNALGGAQAMCDRALEVIGAYVATFNERLEAAQEKGNRLDEEAKSYDELVAEWCGTPAVDHRGQPNLGIAGAVGPEKALEHMTKGMGNLRTKMTTIFNFMRPFSKTALDEAKERDMAFFDRLGGDQDKLMAAILLAKTENRRKAQEHQRAVEEARTNGGKPPERPRESGLVGEVETGAVVNQANTRGHTPRDSGVEAQSQRTAGTEGVDAHRDELAFMKIDQEKLNESRLTWKEGMNVWRLNEDDTWVQMARELSLPLKAGPSGTTDRIMQTNEQLGATTPVNSRAAALAYLLGINAHSLIEIMAGAAPYGAFPEPLNRVAVYKEIKPFGNLSAYSPNDTFWKAVLEG
jgi:hypothetical protein